jgi:hypothetical protein
MRNQLIILLMTLVIVICIFGIIFVVHRRKKKKNKERLEKLDNWIKKAKTLGYTYIKMEGLLQFYGWENDLIKKMLKENGMRPPFEE